MIRYVVGMLLLVTLAPLGRSAEDPSIEWAKFEQKQEIQNRLFWVGFERFGTHLHVTAVLEACAKEDLAKAVAVSRKDKTSFLMKEASRKEAWNDKSFAFLQSLTTTETLSMVSAASDQLWSYEMGYAVALRTVGLRVGRLSAVCVSAVKMADDLLKESAK